MNEAEPIAQSSEADAVAAKALMAGSADNLPVMVQPATRTSNVMPTAEKAQSAFSARRGEPGAGRYSAAPATEGSELTLGVLNDSSQKSPAMVLAPTM